MYSHLLYQKRKAKRGKECHLQSPSTLKNEKIHYDHPSPLTYLFPHTYLLQLDLISKTKLNFLKTFKTLKRLKMELEIKNGHKLIARLQHLI